MDRRFPLPPKKISTAPTDSYLPIYVGQKLNGDDHISTVQSWPHALVAGTTGSGKTLFLTGLIKQIANESRFPSKLIVVDGKGESDYFGAASTSAYHPRFPNPETTMSATAVILEWLVQEEIPRRRALLNSLAKERNSRVDGKTEYLEALNRSSDPLFEPIVVVIDEFAELMLERGPTMQSFVDNVSSVCQTGRSTLVHLILATQRPDRKIVPGRIHANLDTKVALRVPTPADSMTVLGYGGAEKLLGLGDMLFSWKGSDNLRLQGYNFS
jgi:S-DNA-T family DNA segregation ATPase FtsK/SpoIIIE